MYYCAKLGNILRKTNPECFLYPHYRDYTEGNGVLTFIGKHGGKASIPCDGRKGVYLPDADYTEHADERRLF